MDSGLSYINGMWIMVAVWSHFLAGKCLYSILQGRGHRAGSAALPVVPTIDHQPALSFRYIGSMVADFHRNRLHGGVFAYPATPARPNGKIRLLYEAAPLAFLAEHAGGYGSDGKQRILDIIPTDLHQRTPVFIGNRDLVEKAEEFLKDC